MGRDVSGPEFFEARLTDHLEQLFQSLGLPYERHTVEPQRDNILARLDGDGSSDEIVLLEVHQDTVPVDGMTIEPWAAGLKDGRIYGRGACDIKGGMAAMICALARLANEPVSARPNVVLACTVNEEHGYSGASHLAKLWESGESLLLPQAPDVAIVAEPTDLNVVVAHKGTVRWRCHTLGRAAHSSDPSQGDNALYRMARVLQALETYATEVAPTLAEHPLVGRPTLSVGTITGGLSVNTVPDHCTIEIDRRLLPGESPQEAFDHIVAYVNERVTPADQIVHDPPFLPARGLGDEINGPLAERLQAAARPTVADSQIVGVPYGTDAAVFNAAGVPTVVFGPGSINQAHTKDEWLAVDQLKLASQIYYDFCRAV